MTHDSLKEPYSEIQPFLIEHTTACVRSLTFIFFRMLLT